MKRILQQIVNVVRQTIIESGNGVAAMMATSKFSTSANYDVAIASGPVLYEKLNGMLKNFNYREISMISECENFKIDNVEFFSPDILLTYYPV